MFYPNLDILGICFGPEVIISPNLKKGVTVNLTHKQKMDKNIPVAKKRLL